MMQCWFAVVCMALAFGTLSNAQVNVVACRANQGAVVKQVCLPISTWPLWFWGCSWHSCPIDTTCVGIPFRPFFECVKMGFVSSPCCDKSVKYCAALATTFGSRAQYCVSETWKDTTDCASPALEFCTKRMFAEPKCVPRTCSNTACPPCTRCVSTKAGGVQCVRICEFPCTKCPFGYYCIDHVTYGAVCSPWKWWLWHRSITPTPMDLTKLPITCATLACPSGVCTQLPTGPVCGPPCTVPSPLCGFPIDQATNYPADTYPPKWVREPLCINDCYAVPPFEPQEVVITCYGFRCPPDQLCKQDNPTSVPYCINRFMNPT